MPGGTLAREKAARATKEFISLRGPMGEAKLALSHAPIFAAVCRIAEANAATNPGASPGEVSQDTGHPESAVRGILASLTRSGVLRNQTTHVGWQGTRARYFPTEIGRQLFALASVLPMGSRVQVGKTQSAFSSRSRTEPANLFDHARFLRAGADAPVDLEYS